MKYFRLFILLVATILLSTCINSKKTNIKIGLMWPYTTSARMTVETDEFNKKAKELGCEILVTDAKNDEKLQRTQAEDLIKQGAEVLVIMAVNAYTAAEIIRFAHDNGVKVIAYDRLISNCDVDFYISHNNYNVGKYMAEYALKLKPQGNYFLLGGDKSDRNAIMVKNGQKDALKDALASRKVNIIYDVYVEDWSGENAFQIVDKYLKLNSLVYPDVILSSYDGLSYGATEALEANNIDPSQVLITGQDAEPKAIKNIVANKQTMTIFKPLKILADQAVEVAIQLSRGEKPQATSTMNNNRIEVPSILFDPIVVDKTNIIETVIKEGLMKESDL